MIRTELKRGTAELAVLSVLEEGPLHGYEMGRRIELQSGGTLRYTLAALYPLLYRMEHRGWLRGDWETEASGKPLLPAAAARPQDVETDARGVDGFVSRAAARGQGDACVIGAPTCRNGLALSAKVKWTKCKLPMNWLDTWKNIRRHYGRTD